MKEEIYHLQRLAAGDESGFDYVFSKYHVKIYRYVAKFVKSPVDVEEITADTFVLLWKKRQKLRLDQPIGGLLFKISRDLCLSYLRKVARDKSLREQYLDFYSAAHPTAEDEILFQENVQIAQRAVGELPPKRRLVFQMRYVENMENHQIATQLGISPNTVRVHLVKASKFVRSYIRKHAWAESCLLLFAYPFFI